MKIGSLFSGYGGLESGVQAVIGGEVAWVSDIDKGACKVLAHRYPGVPNLGDITKIDWSSVEPVDVICGGSPCQDVSHAGKRAGMTEGTRSNLWVAMREAIATIRPRLVIWENVGGAYSAAADSELVNNPRLLADTRRRDGEPVLRALGRVLGDLDTLGYVGGWHGLRAADVGAPHGRLRVFVVAVPAADAGRIAGEVSTERRLAAVEQPAGDGSARRALLPTPRATDGTKGGPNQRGSSGDLMLPSAVALLPTPTTTQRGPDGRAAQREGAGPNLHNSVALLPTPAVNDMGAAYTPDEWDAWTERMKAEHGNGNGHGKLLNIEAQRLLPTPRVENNENRQSEGYGGKDGNFHGLITGQTSWGQYAAAIARWEQITRPAPPPTETGPKGNPRLSPRFTEWLMGVPDGWICDVPGVTRNESLKLAGNGVVPQQSAAAIRFLLPIIAGLEVAA